MPSRLETLFAPLNFISNGLGKIWAYILMYFGMIVNPVNRAVGMVLRGTSAGKKAGPILDTGLGVAALLFSYVTQASDIEQDGNYFAVNLLTARVVFFISGLLLALLGAAQLAALIGEVVPGLPDLELFSDSYKEYSSSLKHGAISLLLISMQLIVSVDNDDGKLTWSGSESNDNIHLFFLIMLIAALFSRWFAELEHGVVSRVRKGEKDDLTPDLKPEYGFKHARGPALLVSVGLFIYMRVHSDVDSIVDFLTDSTVTLLLAIYVVVVSLERLVSKTSELVIGEEAGLVVTGALTTAMLIFSGNYVAAQKTQESVFVALGVVMLDAMRVGYGMKSPSASLIRDREAIIHRLLQILIGVISFLYVTKTESDQHAATTPVLFGVALAAALTKLLSLSYISKEMFSSGTEHFFRSLASTGLLLTSAYLWSHPLDDSASHTAANLFFSLAILSRLLDSVLDFRLRGGRNLAEYVAWDSDADLVNSPTIDNPRTWLTFLALVGSLIFAGMAMDTKWESIDLNSDTRNDELSSGMITAVCLIAVHVAVVLAAMVASVMNDKDGLFALASLSRSRFVRFAVSTVVLSSLAVAAGQLGFDGSAALNSQGAESELLTGLVAYVFADTIGRGLL